MRAHLLHSYMFVDTDSRRIRARFRVGFVRIRGDSRGFALVFGNNEKMPTQKITRIHIILQMAGPQKGLRDLEVLTPFIILKANEWIAVDWGATAGGGGRF